MKKSSFSDFEVGAKFKIFNKTSNNISCFSISPFHSNSCEVFLITSYGLLSRINVSHDLNNESQIGYNIGYNKSKNGWAIYLYNCIR